MSAGALEIFITHTDNEDNRRARVITIKSLDLDGPDFIIHHVDDTTEKICRERVHYLEIHSTN